MANREERRHFYCVRHRPPLPILKIVVTIEETAKQETVIELGEVLCGTCRQAPLLQEIAQDRMPKAGSKILTRRGAAGEWH